LFAAGCNRPTTDTPYRFVVGERASYALAYESTSASDFSAAFGASDAAASAPSPMRQAFATTVRGTMTFTVLERDGGEVVTAVRIADARVSLTVNGQDAVEDAARIAAELGRPAFARVSVRGRINSVLLDPTLGATARGYALSLLAATQFVFPEGRRPAAWTVEEDGPNGTYVADYRQAGEESAALVKGVRARFVKTKLRYLPAPKRTVAKTIEIAMVVTPRGTSEALFDFDAGRLISIEGTETEDFSINERPVGNARNTIRLVFQGRDDAGRAELASLVSTRATWSASVGAVPISASAWGREAEAASYRKDLGDATLASLTAELHQAEASAGPTFDPTSLYLKFRALVYLHPEACAAVSDLLGDARPDGATMKVLCMALNAIGTADAQAALAAAVARRRTDEGALFKLLFALSTVAEPTPAAEGALRDLADRPANPNIAIMARLALGSMARRLKETAPPRAAAIVDRLMHELAAAHAPEAQKPYLLALGNAGSSDMLPALRPFLDDANADLRTAAVGALRFLDSAEAGRLLLHALASDSEAEVRAQAASALEKREVTPEIIAAEKDVLMRDRSPAVRLAVMANLWKARRSVPAVEALIEEAARTDASKDVRDAAAALLNERQ
jgi:hypothetical protein